MTARGHQWSSVVFSVVISVVISGHQRGHQWSSAVRVGDGTRGALRVAISGHQWPSVAIRCHQCSSVVIRCHQTSISRQSRTSAAPRDQLCKSRFALGEGVPVMARGHQWSSVVISGHQWSSVVISGHHQGEGVPLLVPLLPHTAMQLRLRHPLL